MIRYTFLLLLMFISFISLASAAGPIVGISPANVNFENVLRGGYAERLMTVSIDSEEGIPVVASSRGEISDWLNYTNSSVISRDNPWRMLISVLPPSDVPNGNYSGFLVIATDTLSSNIADGNAVGVVRANLEVAINVEITDNEFYQCSAKEFSVSSVERGDDLVFNLKIRNQGNIRISPDVVIDVWDQEQLSIIGSFNLRSDEILPTREDEIRLKVPSDDFDFDQYWVDVQVPDCFSEDTLTFDVYEPGSLRANGILVDIASVVFSEVGETIPISAIFKNTGEKRVNARFEGQIIRDGRIIQVLKSGDEEVEIGTETNFTFLFTPEKIGKYIVSGRIFYDRKRTYEDSTIINVLAQKFTVTRFLIYAAYFVILLVIAYLIIKIRRERRRYSSRVRRAGFRI